MENVLDIWLIFMKLFMVTIPQEAAPLVILYQHGDRCSFIERSVVNDLS